MPNEKGASVIWLTGTAWAALLVFAATCALTPVSLEHIGADLDIGFDLKGLLAALRSGVLAISTLTVGYLADRCGKRWFLGGGMCVIALGMLWVGQSGAYIGLVGGMMAVGLGLGCVEALASPLIAELHPDRVETHMNVLHAFFPAGLLVASPLVGRALDVGVPWRLPFTLAAIPAVLVGVMFAAGRYPVRADHVQSSPLAIRRILATPMFWLLAVAMMLTAGAEGSLILWSPSFIQQEYQTSALLGGTGLMVFSAAMAAGRFGTGAAARSVPLPRIMLGLIFLCAAVTLCLVLVRSFWASLGSLLMAGLFIACFWPSILTIATRRIAAGSSTLLAMLAVAGIAGFGVMPWAVGQLAAHRDLRFGLGIVPAALAVAGVVLVVVFALDGTRLRGSFPGSPTSDPHD